jgi:hypothetical protein
MSEPKKAKMAIPANAVPGVETDGKGNTIPLEERTEEDQQKVRKVIADAAKPDEAEDKNPDGEFQNPAPMPEGHPSQNKPLHHDLQGNQGGQKGGAREPR